MEISTIMLNSDVFLTFKGQEYRQIKISDIILIKSDDKYVDIQTTQTHHIICTSITNVARYLVNFIKVSNTLIINQYYISKIIKNPTESQKYFLIFSVPTLSKEFLTLELSSYLAKRVIKQL